MRPIRPAAITTASKPTRLMAMIGAARVRCGGSCCGPPTLDSAGGVSPCTTLPPDSSPAVLSGSGFCGSTLAISGSCSVIDFGYPR